MGDGESGSELDDAALPVPPEDSDVDAGEGEDKQAGGFKISSALEAEYDRMMKKTSKEMEIMRKPNESELAKRQKEADNLKRQIDAWKAMIEFRIHLEGGLAIGHRLPNATAAETFGQVDPAVSASRETAAKEIKTLIGEFAQLQNQLARQSDLKETMAEAHDISPSGEGEEKAWAALDGKLMKVMDWTLGAADHWKERTKLDSRKSFKVLDQSLNLQMRAVSELATEKVQKRCCPAPGKYKVFGSAVSSSDSAANGNAEADANAENAANMEIEKEQALNIVEDHEFYVQLLREVLSGNGSREQAGLNDDSSHLRLELQGKRAKKDKARAEVERRASKGRKIRYTPIEKLQNFMAPRPRNGGVNEEDEEVVFSGDKAGSAFGPGAIDALLRSIFAPVSQAKF